MVVVVVVVVVVVEVLPDPVAASASLMPVPRSSIMPAPEVPLFQLQVSLEEVLTVYEWPGRMMHLGWTTQ